MLRILFEFFFSSLVFARVSTIGTHTHDDKNGWKINTILLFGCQARIVIINGNEINYYASNQNTSFRVVHKTNTLHYWMIWLPKSKCIHSSIAVIKTNSFLCISSSDVSDIYRRKAANHQANEKKHIEHWKYVVMIRVFRRKKSSLKWRSSQPNKWVTERERNT